MTDSNRTITLKELAYQAVAKHSRRILKHEVGVLLDKDSEDSVLISEIAISFNTERKMQLEEVGFDLKNDAIDCDYCEALNFFIDRHKHHHSFKVLRNLRIFLSNDLKAKNISFVLPTF
ncbi:hypothetical protein I4641_21620 [Waterburya agarophytonicola K14]|uniref:Uncharacterized protein n=1 Tax=Waterburya agarophytonicola KI4 TaxID=2874699 RepID=A0A964FI17_9CYAN|nr:hypothetical protein [Waterburya agarophytonicola]MCC0179561.1 hypothetical protein [Waterburya agarophytonicola KI4]